VNTTPTIAPVVTTGRNSSVRNSPRSGVVGRFSTIASSSASPTRSGTAIARKISELRKEFQNRSSAQSSSKFANPTNVPASANPGQSRNAYHQLAISG
jgi:hypothetical protein